MQASLESIGFNMSKELLFLNGAHCVLPKRTKPQLLTGELWGITTFFNPLNHQNKIDNLRVFSERVRRQGLKLLIVEAVHVGQPSVFDHHDAEIVIHVETSGHLWQKERLLNIGERALPDSCDKIVWLDCDVLFEESGWVSRVSSLLNKFVVVQPFSSACWLLPDVDIANLNALGLTEYERTDIGTAYAEYGSSVFGPFLRGHMGFAWASRRSLFSGIGFYDRLILGGGDNLIASAMFGLSAMWLLERVFPLTGVDSAIKWMEEFHRRVEGSVYYVSGRIFHIWHGHRKNRMHDQRLDILKRNHFDPDNDIVLSSSGCWEWATKKTNLHQEISLYFESRREEEKDLAMQ